MILAHYNGGKNIIFEWRKMLSNCGAVNSFFSASSEKKTEIILRRVKITELSTNQQPCGKIEVNNLYLLYFLKKSVIIGL